MNRTESLLVIVPEAPPGRCGADTRSTELASLPFAVDVTSTGPLWRDLRSAVQAARSAYVVILHPDEPVDAASIEVAVAGLEGAPEAVLGVAALLWRPPAVGIDISTRELPRGGAAVHEGRRLARLLALRAVTFPSWNGVVLRSAALGADLPRCPDLDPATRDSLGAGAPLPLAAVLGSLTLELLARGAAWSGQHLGYCRRPELAVVRDVEAWSRALRTAERLGVLDRTDDLERAARNLRHEAERGNARDRSVDAPELPRPAPPVVPLIAPTSPSTVAHEQVQLPLRVAVRKQWPLRRFLLAAGDYNDGSAGLVALHMLCDRLNRRGYEAKIAPFSAGPGVPAGAVTNPGWLTPIARMGERFERTVAVYPEIVPGNPLGSPWVVRWLLNLPGRITGVGMDAGPDDFVVTWSEAIAPGVPVLNLPLTDLATYFAKQAPGKGRLLWVGKGDIPAFLDRTAMTEITRSWPVGRPAMANLLRSAELLVSCDWLTSLTMESILCGTPVAFAGTQEWSPGVPMQVETLVGPGNIVCPDGRPTSEELALATAACADRRVAYLESIGRIDEEVDRFVAMVNEHFDRVAHRSLAVASA